MPRNPPPITDNYFHSQQTFTRFLATNLLNNLFLCLISLRSDPSDGPE